MQTSKCSNCGADIDYAAKFCRRCGQAIDPSEWATRNLEEPSKFEQPPRFESPTRPANSWSTSPTYLPPGAMPPQVITPGGMESSGQKKTVIALAAVIAVLVIALAGLGIFLFAGGNRQATPPPFPPPGGVGQPAPPPRVPSPPGVPGQPTPPAAPAQPDSISGELIYPGSKVTMEMSGGRKGRVVKLNTPDAIDKVVDWYVNKIGPVKQVKLPGGNTTLTREGLAVVITPEDNGTSILLTQGEN